MSSLCSSIIWMEFFNFNVSANPCMPILSFAKYGMGGVVGDAVILLFLFLTYVFCLSMVCQNHLALLGVAFLGGRRGSEREPAPFTCVFTANLRQRRKRRLRALRLVTPLDCCGTPSVGEHSSLAKMAPGVPLGGGVCG